MAERSARHGGTLHVKLGTGLTPRTGDVIDLIDASQVSGQFDSVVVDGHKATPLYRPSGVEVRIDG